ncbi:UDP-2,4-diacetamido-2,4,6-trideoxy-beta-L-altropyranose hydrolase [Kosakonia pseudosacchari]|uniref:UDP-2,4-diacetamido-2,4, 6-trideoxy-beta-L-altropyranose hydrolase n=1 Tax=Kosakonia pseudosacchari TaxID=1646340 RepID=UPI0022F0BA7B|nr:UDP-2,4-diacetamido-2,4,6-trideoxy-beta-L-altropyranose hydrolase [Kosakonia pseudosacchari]WBU50966.1 UDP-2,4-diacetamido-2,4,6-trideoxy-beta-L-altropyranose hydrolase [Kosakonia pseudosacchari]
MNIYLRTDSSLSIGSGHVIRCLNLAKVLRKSGAQCFFISKNHRGNIIDKIIQEGFSTKIITIDNTSDAYIRDEKFWLNGSQRDDALQFISLIEEQDQHPDIIIVDHYSLDKEWEEIVKKRFSSARLVVIDDLCNRHHFCDLLIDQTYQRRPEEYASLNENNGLVLAGTKFALLNPLFAGLRKQSIACKEKVDYPKTLMLTMGGVDAHNITGKVLEYLAQAAFKNIDKITVILGSAFPHRDEIYALAAKSNYNVEVLTNVTNMAELMLGHDFAIGALGGTTWERCTMALPAVNIAIADNQLTIAKNLSNSGAIVLYADNFKKDEFVNAVQHLFERYHEQRILVTDICDGLGLFRDIQEIIPVPAKDGINVTLRLATQEDINFVYQLQCEPHTRKFARNPDIPSFGNHVVWMTRKLNDDKSQFYIIEHGSSCGVLRLDPIRHASAKYEISIFLTASVQGKGVASAAIKRTLILHNGDTILATVLPENYASHQLFDRLGFIKISPDEYISEKK